MKILKYLTFVLSNIAFVDTFFYFVEKKNYSIAVLGLEQVLNDLISLNINSTLSYLSFSLIVGLTIGSISFFAVFRNKKTLSPLDSISHMIKLFFINSTVLLTSIYIFRFFNFSRLYIILNLFIYPILFFIIYFLIAEITKKKIKLYLILTMISLFSFAILLNVNKNSRIAISNFSDETVDTSLNIENQITDIGLLEQNSKNIKGSSQCFKWSGSNNFVSCLDDFEITLAMSFNPDYINNFVKFNDQYFTVFKSGKILLDNSSVFLDISTKVLNSSVESGLFDIAFHPNEKYFIISYVSNNNYLTIEKFPTGLNNVYRDGEVILEVPNSTNNHYCGSLEWSNFFNAFLICVGDGGQPNAALNTTSYKGKILVLSNTSISSPELISESKNQLAVRNIIGYGLRNPWNFIEYQNNLIIPDVGNSSSEELNIVNLDELATSKKPFLFGWPIFEGSVKNNETYYDLNIWSSQYDSVYQFVNENTTNPLVYYDRPAPENTRAAILGTLIIEDSQSIFHNHIVFADFVSKEIFFYDYIEDELFILNIPPFPGVLTAIGVHPNDKSQIAVSISDDKSTDIYYLKLP